MLGGLTREVRWREVSDALPQKLGYVLVTHLSPNTDRDSSANWDPGCRPAYWNGREFMTTEPPYYQLSTVTHWMPYPELPNVDEMRRVFHALLMKE